MTQVLDYERFATKCQHNKFKCDESLAYVECGICGEKLNPIWVIKQFTYPGNRLESHLEYLKKLISKANAKNRCKCRHCGKMTVIQRER